MDAQSGPGTPESLSNEHFAWESIPRESTSYPGHDNMSYEDAEEPWWEAEIENLKSNLKALNIQMFEQKKQWLAEKTALEAAAAAAGPGHASSLSPTGSRSFNAVGSLSGGGGRIDSGLSRSAGLARNGTLLERSPGLDRAGVFQDDPSVLRGQLQAANSALAAMTAERDAARQEVAVMKSQAQRWNVERASLQREVEVLRASQGATGIPASGMRTPVQSNNDEELLAALAAAEEEKAALMAELDTVKQSLKSSMQVHKNHVAQITGGVGGQAAMNAAAMSAVAAMGRGPTNASPCTTTSTNGADPSATIARLNAEITRLQADLYIIKDECVPVPKAEFASLKGIHTEKASTEQELRAVRQELADVTRLNKMLREEMELIKEEHIAITMQEYDELRRAAAEKQALELKLEAQAKYYAQVPKEELEEMKAARRAVAGLETRLAAMQAVTVVAQDDTTRALALASNEAADLRIKLMETEATSNELRRELAVAEGRATVILELQERLRTAEASLVAAQQEKARAALRLRALEEELSACKTTMQQAQEESARLAKDLGSVRDTCSGLAQEVSTLTRERGELEARLGESRSEREKVTNDLVDAKLELARLREMEVHFRKKVLTQQKALYGLPSTYESG